MDIDLQIPDFLLSKNRPAAAAVQRRTAKLKMPAPALVPVSRAVGNKHDTFQKIRKAVPARFTDAQVRDALKSLITNGTIVVDGRRYTKR
jgi:hypothetical protein